MAKTKLLNYQAVELELTLAGTDTAAKPLTKALDRSGKITFEFPSGQSDSVDALMKLSYDEANGLVYPLHILAERSALEPVQREKKKRGRPAKEKPVEI